MLFPLSLCPKFSDCQDYGLTEAAAGCALHCAVRCASAHPDTLRHSHSEGLSTSNTKSVQRQSHFDRTRAGLVDRTSRVGLQPPDVTDCRERNKKTVRFFPRVRTPCGHGAQVIIEGREIQSDGGEKDKDNPTTKQPPTTAHRPSLHHPVVFPLCQGETSETKTTDYRWA